MILTSGLEAVVLLVVGVVGGVGGLVVLHLAPTAVPALHSDAPAHETCKRKKWIIISSVLCPIIIKYYKCFDRVHGSVTFDGNHVLTIRD